jgi:hypothetical protein
VPELSRKMRSGPEVATFRTLGNLRNRQPLVLTFKKDQRLSAGRVRCYNLANDDRVIASIVALPDSAFDVTERGVQYGRPIRSFSPLQPGEFIYPFGGKAAGNILLLFAEEVDCESIHRLEAVVALRRLINADEDQRGIQRQRHEGVGGKPVGRSFFVLGRDDGYAGGEMTHYSAQLLRIDRHVV